MRLMFTGQAWARHLTPQRAFHYELHGLSSSISSGLIYQPFVEQMVLTLRAARSRPVEHFLEDALITIYGFIGILHAGIDPPRMAPQTVLHAWCSGRHGRKSRRGRQRRAYHDGNANSVIHDGTTIRWMLYRRFVVRNGLR